MISGSAVVTLAGVHIDTAQGAALEVDDHAGTDVTLILENDNTLISRKREKAGLHKSRGQSGGIDTGTLLIKGEGSLYAQGGAAQPASGPADITAMSPTSPSKAERSRRKAATAMQPVSAPASMAPSSI